MSGPIQRCPRLSPDLRSAHYYVSKKTDRGNTQAHTHTQTQSRRLMLLSGRGMRPARPPCCLALFTCVRGPASHELLSSRPKSSPGQRALQPVAATAGWIWALEQLKLPRRRRLQFEVFLHQLHASEQLFHIVPPEGSSQHSTFRKEFPPHSLTSWLHDPKDFLFKHICIPSDGGKFVFE